jgi:hypothetical protein
LRIATGLRKRTLRTDRPCEKAERQPADAGRSAESSMGYPPSNPQIDRRLALVRAVAAGVALLAMVACTVLAPMQKPPEDRPFALDKASRGDASCQGDPDECRAKNLDRFAGDLGFALWEVDERRRELIGFVVDRGNLTSTYNALLWPVGAHLINKKYRDREWSVRDSVALAIASWGLLNSGIPERDKLYLSSANEMLCSMVVAEVDLYPRSVVGSDRVMVLVTPPPGSLSERVRTLEKALNDFEREREAVIVGLQVKVAPAPPEEPAIDRRRREAQGRKLVAVTYQSPKDNFAAATLAMVTGARAELVRLREAERRILRSGIDLRIRRSRIDEALVRALSDRVELKNPFDVAREINGIVEQQRAAEKRVNDALAQSGNGARSGEWLPSPEATKGLTDAGPLNRFWLKQVPDLREARRPAQDWLRLHAQRQKDAREATREMGCNGGTLAAFAESLLRSVAPAGSAASGADGGGDPKPSVELLK